MIYYFFGIKGLYVLCTHPKRQRLWSKLETPSLNEVHLVLEQLLAARLFGFVVHHRRVGSHR